MTPPVNNLFDHPPDTSSHEEVRSLMSSNNVRIEHIVSNGQGSPEDFWYDQPEGEWVLLLKGTAVLEWAAGSTLKLKAGDYLVIPAHMKHRVDQCSLDAVWVVVHYGSE
jgi:cupin 2 domain-containing protein